MSRGAVLAMRTGAMLGGIATTAAGAAIAVACNGLTETTIETVAVADAGEDATMDAFASATDAPSDPNAPQPFACGTATCVWPVQLCVHSITSDMSFPCSGGDAAARISESYDCQSWTPAHVPGCSYPTKCGCVADAGLMPPPTSDDRPGNPDMRSSEAFACAGDGGAGFIQSNELDIVGCGGCYGSPPPRLERLLA